MSVDNSPWDGNAAMSMCGSASDYASVCAGRRAGDPSMRATWALPHHKRPGGPPNANGVRAALSALPKTQGLTNRAAAQRHLEAHMNTISPEANALPTTGLVRALDPSSYELRDDPSGGDGRTLFGHLLRYNEWTEIDSIFEGRFMERIAPGSATATIEQDRAAMKVTYNHGHSPYGDLVLGPIQDLREDDQGVAYEVPMFPSVPPLLMDGLRAGVYGASFRFRVAREDFQDEVEPSDYNPKGLPERTIQEVRISEFGPVTFPAYAGATAGVRSLTDEFLTEAQLEEFRALAEIVRSTTPQEAEEKTGTTPPSAGRAKVRRRKHADYLSGRTEPSWKL